jgi:CRP-like cAMP-binding protein
MMHQQYDLILIHISQYIDITAEEETIFINLLLPKRIPKKSFLYKENEVAHAIAFVTSGCLRAYTIDDEGIEHILQFAPTNWWVSDMYSNITGQPARLNIEALEDTEVLLLSRTNQELLSESIPKFDKYFRILLEKSLVASQQRVLDNLELTAVERFYKFCNSYTDLIHTIPQKYIAAYLGITPEFLSKTKAAYFKNK